MTSTTAAIRDAFRRSGWTQAQLAARAEVCPRTVWLVLQGEETKASSRDAVCWALGLSQIPIASPAHFAPRHEIR